jgi:hypothetical protein
MLDARLNVGRVEQRHGELSRAAACSRTTGAEQDTARCAEPVLARAVRPRPRRPSLRLRFVAALWRG